MELFLAYHTWKNDCQFIEITPQYLLSELLKILLKALLNVKVHNAFHFALK